MFIDSVRLRDTVADVLMREIVFHRGANLVVDAVASDRHNKVGKTTFLKLIDVLLGANGKDRLYKDDETNSINDELRCIIEQRRVIAEMTLVEELDNGVASRVELEVELFRGGHYFFNREKVNARKYRELLRDLFFDIGSDKPTFRQLIKSFVRISLSGDNNAFLKTVPNTSIPDYRAIYNYLFGISDSQLDAELSKLNKELKKTRDAAKQYRRLADVEDDELLSQLKIALERECNSVAAALDDILDAREFKANREAIEDARNRYASLCSEISEIDYRLSRNQQALENAVQETQLQADLSLSRRFYDEVRSLLPGVNKTFEELVEFNRQLCENKITYFRELGELLKKDRECVVAKLNELLGSSSKYLALLDENALAEYERLMDECLSLKRDMGKVDEQANVLRRYAAQIQILEERIASLSSGGAQRESAEANPQERMDSFNHIFTAMAYRVNSERPILAYSSDTKRFPVSITDLNGSSTGTRKSLLAVFDLSYQQFAVSNGINTPRFVVHDVIENVEGDDLRKIVKEANGINCQFIIAVLQEKLDSSGISDQETLKVLELSADDKLFQGKTVEENESTYKIG